MSIPPWIMESGLDWLLPISLEGTRISAAVLRSERGKTCEVRGERLEEEGGMSNAKWQSPNGEISGRAEKRALSKVQMERSLGERKNEL